MMKTIGITGNIGSGKSQVTACLLAKGYKVLDADQLVKQIYCDSDFIADMIATFGTGIIATKSETDNELRIDKKAVAATVFNDEMQLDRLNRLIAPYISKKMKDQIEEYSKTEAILFMDIPLLYEKKMQGDFYKVILVYCEDRLRYRRAAARDQKTLEEIIRVDSFQMPQDKKLGLADYVIRNDGELTDLIHEVDRVLENINSIEDKRNR